MNVVGHRRSRRRDDTAPASTAPPSAADPPAPPSAPSAPSGTIRRRLVNILALPVLAVLVLLGFVTVIEVSDYRSSTATTRSVSTALSVQELVQELQTERGLTAGLLGGNLGLRAEIPPIRERVDQRLAEVERLTADGGDVGDRVHEALAELDGLPATRSATDNGTANRAVTFAYFTGRIEALNDVDFGLGHTADQRLRRAVGAMEALAQVTERTAQARAFLNGVFSAGGFTGYEFVQFAAMRAARELALTNFGRQATAKQRAAMTYVLDTGAAREAAHFEQVALVSADGRRLQVNPQSWWSALTTVLDDMLHMQRYVGAEIQAWAEERQVESAQWLGALAGVVGVCLAGAVLLLVIASRSITRPLAGLAAEADLLASERLPAAVTRTQATTGEGPPEPPDPVRVPARSSSEIHSVADALDRVQAVAYRLATEQAMLRRSTSEALANLGRRNQNLLRRQLAFITVLEREESDPAGLANLFELDHLATRMRRNAESLLVLVGASAPRQWAAPLPIVDVIRAAISEVEEYRRVALRRVDEAFVAGSVVSGIAHLLAELVENGLTFSPPDCDVEIQGRRSGDGYLIAITDQGVGMEPQELEAANARLRGEGDFLLAPTRYLGHYVVGQLARGMGASVQLAPSPVTGVTARVILPANLLAVPPQIQPVEVVTGTLAGPSPVPDTAESLTRAHVIHPAEPASRQPESPAPAQASAPVLTDRPLVEYVTASGAAVTGAPTGAHPTYHGASGGWPIVDAAPRAAAARAGTVGAPVATAEPERTANGLRKRPPRSRRPAAGEQPTEQTTPAGSSASAGFPGTSAGGGQVVQDSPEAVRSRLTALRAGLSRGQVGQPAPAGVPAADGASPQPWRTDDR